MCRSLAAASIFLCTGSFELCYGLNKLYTASTAYTGNHKPEGQAVVTRAQRGHYYGPRVYDFPYMQWTQCITCLDHSTIQNYQYTASTAYTDAQLGRLINRPSCASGRNIYIYIYLYPCRTSCPKSSTCFFFSDISIFLHRKCFTRFFFSGISIFRNLCIYIYIYYNI